MGRGLFITGTDTDVGKTYVTALLVKTLRSAGYDVGYYKAAISGARTVEESDAGFVNRFAQICEPEDMLLSYLYQNAVSPHLAARIEGNRMGRGLFITGTDTDVGKTYVTALLVKTLRSAGYDVGYYKAAISGARTVEESDAGFVNRFAQICEPEDMLLSYLYQNAVSPHLAARIEGNPVEKDVIMSAWERVTAAYPYVTMEGSGGIMCPIRHDEKAVYYLEDIIRWLRLPVLVIADAGLGTINRVVTTCEYIRYRNISVKGIILNHWKGGVMEEDNVEMIEEITGVKVLARVKKGDMALDIDPETIISLYE